MEQAKELDEFPFGLVGEWLADGEIVPFIGAGASAVGIESEAAPPDANGLADELVDTMRAKLPDTASGELAKVAQYFARTAHDRPTLYQFLRKRFETQLENTDPGAVASTLAKAPRRDKPLFLITTNYDSLIERAFRKAGREICVITQNMRDLKNGASAVHLILPNGDVSEEGSIEFDWADRARFKPDCVFLLKMHGSVHVKAPMADDVIITEDDYVDFMVNAGGSSNSPFFPPPSLTAEYKQRPFLFLGYSLSDWNFRAFLRMLARRNALVGGSDDGERRHYAIQREPDPLEVELWKYRNVRLFSGDLGAFCAQVEAEWNGGAS